MRDLNAFQQEAVLHMQGPLLIIAGAGSGKTRVVTERIIHLLNQGIPAEQILAVTFTNKAAAEMRERVHASTRHRPQISTFHSLGALILRESYLSGFVIYDEEDALKLLKSCFKEGYEPKKEEIKEVKNQISEAKNQLLGPLDVKSSDLSSIYSRYEQTLKENRALDFDDLLYMPVKLFRENASLLESYQQRYRYLMVDEYQDTNFAQYVLINLLAQKFGNLCVVGDPDQSIYSWRGADIRNILNFRRDYPHAKMISLEQNYRSTNSILEAANALIACNQSDKELWSELGKGEDVYLYKGYQERDEVYFVVDKISSLHRRGDSLDQMVIFYRTNAQSRIFEDSLIYRGIPYRIVGGLSFYQRREIKDVLAFLRVMHQGSDSVAVLRTINLPKRGIGPSTLDKLRLHAQAVEKPLFTILEEIAQHGLKEVKLSKKVLEGITGYVRLIHTLRTMIDRVSLDVLVEKVIQETFYREYLKEEPESQEDREENLEELVSKAKELEGSSLQTFLEELVLKSSLGEDEGNGERLTLMTLHNGKGLEFENVFIVGLEEELLPHANSLFGGDVKEERRLLYVGMTRAKRRLFLSHVENRILWGQHRCMRASRFLSEIGTTRSGGRGGV